MLCGTGIGSKSKSPTFSNLFTTLNTRTFSHLSDLASGLERRGGGLACSPAVCLTSYEIGGEHGKPWGLVLMGWDGMGMGMGMERKRRKAECTFDYRETSRKLGCRGVRARSSRPQVREGVCVWTGSTGVRNVMPFSLSSKTCVRYPLPRLGLG